MMTGERLFRIFCVQRGGSWVGQFNSRADANAAKAWATANFPASTARVRPRNYTMATLGRPMYELKIACS